MDNNTSSPSSDHDLLIELRTEMRGMRADMSDLSRSVSLNTSDHEDRIRELEKKTDNLPLLTKIVYGGVTIILVAFMAAVVYKFIPQNTSSHLSSVSSIQ